MGEGLNLCVGVEGFWELKPRSHGGSRLSGDLPGRSVDRWRKLGFVYLPRRRFFMDGELNHNHQLVGTE
jgi:hypothetical protein